MLSKAPRRSFLSKVPSLLMSINLKQSLYIWTCSSEKPPSFCPLPILTLQVFTGNNSRVKMGKGQNEGGFSEEQVQMYKDCFKLMDINKDGTLDKNDLRGAFDNIGVLMSEGELDELMGEVGGPCNVMGMVNMFQEKMAGDGNDPDELILQAFMAYDQGGKIDVKMFQHALMTWGDKMTKSEIDDIFNEFEIDEDYMVKTKEVVGLFVAVKEEDKKEEKKEEAPVEAAPEEEDGDAKKKKKKKKKAAK